MQLEVILVFGIIICLINPVKSGCYDDWKFCSNVKPLEVLDRLTNEYKNQCKDNPWEDNIKKGLDETVSAITRAKAEVSSQFEKVSKIAATALDLEKELEAKERELMAEFERKVKDFEKQKEDMKSINHSRENIIKLNVGGNYFTTSRATLCADKDSMLGVMFSGIHHVTKCDDGAYFVDADGTHFRYILNFLRGKIQDTSQLPSDLLTLHQIKVEANYFQVKGLENMIDPLLQKNPGLSQHSTKKGFPLQQDYINNFFPNSVVYQCQYLQLVSTYPLFFDNLNLDGICFVNAKFQHEVTFRNTSLVGANFCNCQFNNTADFSNADIRRCNFRGSNIKQPMQYGNNGKFKFAGCKHANEAYFN